MRLLCDENLTGLGRWLRAAGYDTKIVEDGTDDDAVVVLATGEERTVLTADRALASRPELAGRAVAIGSNGLDAVASEVAARLGVDWLHAPFTRCLRDNAVLRELLRPEMARLPEPARGGPGPFRTCPACGRIYWPGSHVRRMRARLERWRGS